MRRCLPRKPHQPRIQQQRECQMSQNYREKWPHGDDVCDAPHFGDDAYAGAEDDHEGQAEDAQGECPL